MGRRELGGALVAAATIGDQQNGNFEEVRKIKKFRSVAKVAVK